MERKQNRLTARKIASLKERGRYSDGGGLYLSIGKGAARSWVFLYRRNGKIHELGLGSFLNVSLAQARQKAARMRAELGSDNDPLAIRRATQNAANHKTFGQVALETIASKQSAWRNEKHRGQW